jgi:hypothetical protein
VELFIVYTGTQEIEVHYSAQFADENIKHSLRTVARNQGLRNPQKRFVALDHRPASRSLDTGIHSSNSPNHHVDKDLDAPNHGFVPQQ